MQDDNEQLGLQALPRLTVLLWLYVVAWSCCTGMFMEEAGPNHPCGECHRRKLVELERELRVASQKRQHMRRAMSAAAAHACSTVTSYPRMCAHGTCEWPPSLGRPAGVRRSTLPWVARYWEY